MFCSRLSKKHYGYCKGGDRLRQKRILILGQENQYLSKGHHIPEHSEISSSLIKKIKELLIYAPTPPALVGEGWWIEVYPGSTFQI